MDEQLRGYLQKAAGQLACARDRFLELANNELSDECAVMISRLEDIRRAVCTQDN